MISRLRNPSPTAPAARAPARGRLDAAGVVVLRRRRRGARAGAHLRPHLAVRRPGGAGRDARLVHGDPGRAHPDRRHPRSRGHPPRLRQRLPPSRVDDRAGLRQPRDAAVPVPRVDVRARRLAAKGTALGARSGLRPGRLLAAPRLGRHVGAVPVRQPRSRPRRRSPRRSASCRRSSRGAASTSRRSSSTPITSGRSTPTGRSTSRTTSSATTARPPIPASAR